MKNIQIAETRLLQSNQLSKAKLLEALDQFQNKAIDFGELFLQQSVYESWGMDEQIVKIGTYSEEQGIGIRAITGEETSFAYSDSISEASLNNTIEKVLAGHKSNPRNLINKLEGPIEHSDLYSNENPLTNFTDDEKINLLKKMDTYARQLDSRIEEVSLSLSGEYDIILVAATDGTYQGDVRPLVRFNVSVTLKEGGEREKFSSGGGTRGGYGYFTQDVLEGYIQKAVNGAVQNLLAIEAPAGKMPVVLGSGWPGVLLHEAVGHGLEGDFNRKESSSFSGKIGEKVASELCTVIDDGTIQNRRGSLSIDDEGIPSQKTTLIEKGILKEYIQDKLNASLMGMSVTGNGRRESYAHLPLPRMTNTYMLPGESTLEEMIQSVDKGIYAVNFNGGQVDITSGQFVFVADEAYMIEEGKVTKPIKGATLIGNGLEVMQKIKMVGNDFALDSGVGVCGKEGQSVPVGVGQPSLLISELTVGGNQ
ncbi:metalloprotease TldD [Francisellaceae bacterium]|nr:metalloprotease TldD [Francisellaceae bacterium]